MAYAISYRQLEEMMRERGVDVDPATLNRWVIKDGPALAHAAGGPELADG
ncbi:MAG: IS6 family transposase [Nitrospira sp.]|nr:IS6 family transposase [Nitrospira sp.]